MKIFLWLWIGMGTLAYSWQFSSYIDPVMTLLGLK